MTLRVLPFILFVFEMLLLQAQDGDSVKTEKFSFHAQTTVVNQFKPAFKAPYTGTNSLLTEQESRTSITSTLFMGARLWKGASLFFNPEIAGGSGLSQVLGIADATNGETFRIGTPEPKIYLARLYYKQIISLSNSVSYQSSDFNKLGGFIPDKYFSFTVGKVSISDYFDNNSYSHDPRTQFMCWGLMSNGAWDYPANTRGYTPSVVLEYVSPKHEIRYGISLMPLIANGPTMDWNISKSNSSTLEYTNNFKLFKRKGAIRLLGFYTMAHMGNYEESILLSPVNPNIADTRNYGHTKYGFGINAEQSFNDYAGCFFRASWNDGNNETWAFTQIDHSLSCGLSIKGEKWKRKNDIIGIAYVVSGISKPHRDYLKAGGSDFMLGDGKLNYGLENLSELYYSAQLLKDKIYVSGAYQLLINPGYNRDRMGPVNVFSIRVHLKI